MDDKYRVDERATAEIHADPELAASLQRPITEQDIARESGPLSRRA